MSEKKENKADPEEYINVNRHNVKPISQALHLSALSHMGIMPRSKEELMFLGLALSGEVGELNNILKKMVRDGIDAKLIREASLEIADVFAYLMHISDCFGQDISLVFAEKTDHLVNERKPDWAMDAILQLRKNLNA